MLSLGLKAQVGKASRILLQAAVSSLEYACSEEAQESSAVALCGRTRSVLSRLLAEPSWFRPGAEATADYTSNVCMVVARLVNSLDVASSHGDICVPALLLCADAIGPNDD